MRERDQHRQELARRGTWRYFVARGEFLTPTITAPARHWLGFMSVVGWLCGAPYHRPHLNDACTMTDDFQEDRSVLTRAARAPDRSVRYGSHADQLADAWHGPSDAVSRPLVLMIHGGFWRPEYDRIHTYPMCAAIAEAGWTVATIEYRRIAGEPDATIADVSAALGTVPALIEKHNGRVILVGHSAGGHLCLYAAAARPVPALDAVIALAPAADLQLVESLDLDGGAARDFLGRPASERPDLDPARSGEINVPCVVLHGRQDTIVPLAVSRSYARHHPAARIVEIDDCGHFALIDPQNTAWNVVTDSLRVLSR